MALLESANESYSASLDAYKYGVRNLVDVVTAEDQLAKARLSSVSARSELFIEAVNLEFATGNLLRNHRQRQEFNIRTDTDDFAQTAIALIRNEGIVDTFVRLYLHNWLNGELNEPWSQDVSFLTNTKVSNDTFVQLFGFQCFWCDCVVPRVPLERRIRRNKGEAQ